MTEGLRAQFWVKWYCKDCGERVEDLVDHWRAAHPEVIEEVKVARDMGEEMRKHYELKVVSQW